MATANGDVPEAPTGLHIYTSATPSGYRATILLAELGLPYTLQTVRRRWSRRGHVLSPGLQAGHCCLVQAVCPSRSPPNHARCRRHAGLPCLLLMRAQLAACACPCLLSKCLHW